MIFSGLTSSPDCSTKSDMNFWELDIILGIQSSHSSVKEILWFTSSSGQVIKPLRFLSYFLHIWKYWKNYMRSSIINTTLVKFAQGMQTPISYFVEIMFWNRCTPVLSVIWAYRRTAIVWFDIGWGWRCLLCKRLSSSNHVTFQPLLVFGTKEVSENELLNRYNSGSFGI